MKGFFIVVSTIGECSIAHGLCQRLPRDFRENFLRVFKIK